MDLACVWRFVPFQSELFGICSPGRNRTWLVARWSARDSQSATLPSIRRQRIRSGAPRSISRAASTLELSKLLAGYVERFPSTQSGARLRATAATDFCSYLRRHLHYPTSHLEVLQATGACAAAGTNSENFGAECRAYDPANHTSRLSRKARKHGGSQTSRT